MLIFEIFILRAVVEIGKTLIPYYELQESKKNNIGLKKNN